MQTDQARHAVLAVLARLQDRKVAPATASLYTKVFSRMSRERGPIQVLREGDARDTYHVRRAALAYGARNSLSGLLQRFDQHEGVMPEELRAQAARKLHDYAARIAAALDLDPPQGLQDEPDFQSRSRWQELDAPRPRRGEGSKKHVLKCLPVGWRDDLWNVLPQESLLRSACAVLFLAPCRPGELVPGDRGEFQSEGVHVTRVSRNSIALTTRPLKTHNGKYGTTLCGVIVDIAATGGPGAHLAALVPKVRDFFVVSVQSTAKLARFLGYWGEKAGLPERITPYVCRAQALADAKASFGAGEEVARAAGHCTDRTQRHYGARCHGTRGRIVKAYSERTPKLVAVAKAVALRIGPEAHDRGHFRF